MSIDRARVSKLIFYCYARQDVSGNFYRICAVTAPIFTVVRVPERRLFLSLS